MNAHPTTHACMICGQQGQPVEAVRLTLAATAATPSTWPATIDVDGWTCVDRIVCARMATWRRNAGRYREQAQ